MGSEEWRKVLDTVGGRGKSKMRGGRVIGFKI